jgi:RNA recognition motif-containing protein
MGRQLYVTNISFQATEDDLKRLFAVAGRVRTVKLLTDPDSGHSRGMGFVEMGSEAEAKEAIVTLDDALLIDRQITVVEARPPQPKQQQYGRFPVGDGRPKRGGRGKR